MLLLLFCTLTITTMKAQQLTAPEGAYCDPETGLCHPSPMPAPAAAPDFAEDVEIIYVGDPMCSWCWGISPALNRLERAAEMNGIPYRIVLGGLRPGGGDPWDDEMKKFIGHHWDQVTERSGQPFGRALFERDTFNYDTEPSCRAVVAARTMNPEVESRFFELTQHHFYVLNEDPKDAAFYAPICEELGLDYQEFVRQFNSPEVKAATEQDFRLNRSWGVTGYPTVILRKGNELTALARGFNTFENMWSGVSETLEARR
ncbi:DsbA family protein [Lewinella sp. 4G2]|uniref:DsbA family protein n=1 Tax=Lewinella sp. 4G2 TaxID=1803372 RepID=UPI001E5D750C|nr:DsbA family protein [Lewinella sp. 4G2]